MKKNILVVDDEKEVREMLSRVLTDAGYNVITAENGLRLISIIQTDKIDLIILDIIMQWISGLDLCKSLRKNSEFKNLKIMFISGKATDTEVDQGFNLGCNDFIAKPFDIQVLLKKVKELIG